jgi:hypothetical protein
VVYVLIFLLWPRNCNYVYMDIRYNLGTNTKITDARSNCYMCFTYGNTPTGDVACEGASATHCSAYINCLLDALTVPCYYTTPRIKPAHAVGSGGPLGSRDGTTSSSPRFTAGVCDGTGRLTHAGNNVAHSVFSAHAIARFITVGANFISTRGGAVRAATVLSASTASDYITVGANCISTRGGAVRAAPVLSAITASDYITVGANFINTRGGTVRAAPVLSASTASDSITVGATCINTRGGTVRAAPVLSASTASKASTCS